MNEWLLLYWYTNTTIIQHIPYNIYKHYPSAIYRYWLTARVIFFIEPLMYALILVLLGLCSTPMGLFTQDWPFPGSHEEAGVPYSRIFHSGVGYFSLISSSFNFWVLMRPGITLTILLKMCIHQGSNLQPFSPVLVDSTAAPAAPTNQLTNVSNKKHEYCQCIKLLK